VWLIVDVNIKQIPIQYKDLMITENTTQPITSRRSFLLTATQVVLGLGLVSAPTIACAKAVKKRSLSFVHTRTQQELTLVYASGSAYDRRALTKINRFLRDYNTGQVHVIDPKLLDILWAVKGEMGNKGVYEIVSGFRSPKTNRLLRQGHSGVATKSLHMQGKAVDIRFSGASLAQVRQCALEMQCGGVGYYPRDGFVHLDSGQFRTW
jgi:uncharacterized protein YcbK (DUF882 family)